MAKRSTAQESRWTTAMDALHTRSCGPTQGGQLCAVEGVNQGQPLCQRELGVPYQAPSLGLGSLPRGSEVSGQQSSDTRGHPDRGTSTAKRQAEARERHKGRGRTPEARDYRKPMCCGCQLQTDGKGSECHQ
ncbi:Hypothetical predicted protein [Marmota monax]|uniref:Uncharacterized protein n=1 Tax=Marmota monax TaxID=9995 RepID=A0A5E4CJU1_MARMO|nr:hypothetical protein GHT09_012495 [Marmota monax]VTJ81299.1 Hypothetical predicted protein [Marmota monax]